MRKLISLGVTVAIGVLAITGIAHGGQAATNSKGEFIDLHVAVTPPVAGTAKAPQGVGVFFDSFTGNRINGDRPSHNTSITVRFSNGFKYNGARFPSCKINTKGLTKCSRSEQIGTGSAEVSLPGSSGAAPTFIPAVLVAYNGKPLSGKSPTIIFIASLNGKPSAELDFTAKQQPTGPYGLAFTEIVFPSSGPGFEITKFSIKIPDRTVTRRVNGKSVRIHLLEAPTTCHRSWEFAQTNTFSDGPPLTATDFQPCTTH